MAFKPLWRINLFDINVGVLQRNKCSLLNVFDIATDYMSVTKHPLKLTIFFFYLNGNACQHYIFYTYIEIRNLHYAMHIIYITVLLVLAAALKNYRPKKSFPFGRTINSVKLENT